MSLILKSLYYFLPALMANSAPVLFKCVNVLNWPVNEKLFGKNKTWRGLVSATLFGTFVFCLQKWAYQFDYFKSLSVIDYSGYTILLGVLLSGGAILGDLIKSYYKRREGIKPGDNWIPWDQYDFLIGSLSLSSVVYVVSGGVLIILAIFVPLLHVLTNYLGNYIQKLR